MAFDSKINSAKFCVHDFLQNLTKKLILNPQPMHFSIDCNGGGRTMRKHVKFRLILRKLEGKIEKNFLNFAKIKLEARY